MFFFCTSLLVQGGLLNIYLTQHISLPKTPDDESRVTAKPCAQKRKNIRTILSGRCAHYAIGDMLHKFVVCANGLSKAGSEEEAPKIKDL